MHFTKQHTQMLNPDNVSINKGPPVITSLHFTHSTETDPVYDISVASKVFNPKARWVLFSFQIILVVFSNCNIFSPSGVYYSDTNDLMKDFNKLVVIVFRHISILQEKGCIGLLHFAETSSYR